MSRIDSDDLQLWFGLSGASFLVIPRVLMEHMPVEWQDKMAELLNQYDETFDSRGCDIDECFVSTKRGNKFCKIPENVANYRRPNKEWIESIRKK